MNIEKYKEFVIQKLGTANDCEETKLIIDRLIDYLKNRRLSKNIKTDYLLKLEESLANLSSAKFDYIHWSNIQCAILYLRKLTKSTAKNV